MEYKLLLRFMEGFDSRAARLAFGLDAAGSQSYRCLESYSTPYQARATSGRSSGILHY